MCFFSWHTLHVRMSWPQLQSDDPRFSSPAFLERVFVRLLPGDFVGLVVPDLTGVRELEVVVVVEEEVVELSLGSLNSSGHMIPNTKLVVTGT